MSNTSMTSGSETRLALSWPPSANNLFMNVPNRGRVRTKEYDRWRGVAGWELKAQRPAKFTTPVEVVVELNPPSKRAFDLDNRNKALLDLLVTHGVIPDDSIKYVRSVTAKVVETGGPCTVIVRSV